MSIRSFRIERDNNRFFTSFIIIIGTDVHPGRIELSDGNNSVTIQAPSTLEGPVQLILPDIDGFPGEVLTRIEAGTTWKKFVGTATATYSLLPNAVAVAMTTMYIPIAYFTWIDSRYMGYTAGALIYEADISDRTLDIRLRDVTNGVTIVEDLSVALSGFRDITAGFVNPSSDARLELQIRKSSEGGTDPRIFGVQLEWDA